MIATREEGLSRLKAFLPRAGRDYAALRNLDLPGHPHVSVLSPYVRHRIVTEAEVLEAVLGRFAPATAEKFVQEVFWRTYWKGWLEMRPTVWDRYRGGLARALDRVATEAGLRRDWEAACRGETGIPGFDGWARELADTGYMHNHARMWFASIWIFTLRLPWELGADFFLRHLLDGDPASNTLSWRWVAGLHTRGKAYVATSANIARYTEGRVALVPGLAASVVPLDDGGPPSAEPLPEGGRPDPEAETGLLITEEDLSPGWVLPLVRGVEGTAVMLSAAERSPLSVAPQVIGFTRAAAADCVSRHGTALGAVAGPFEGEDAVEAVADWASAGGLRQVVTPHAPVGPARARLDRVERALLARGIRLVRPLRPYDRECWPHAGGGYFRFRESIPALIGALGLARARAAAS